MAEVQVAQSQGHNCSGGGTSDNKLVWNRQSVLNIIRLHSDCLKYLKR